MTTIFGELDTRMLLRQHRKFRSYRIWRGQDDSNYVITAETFDSREVAERIWTAEETKAAMRADGIDMSTVIIEYVEEAGSGLGSRQPTS